MGFNLGSLGKASNLMVGDYLGLFNNSGGSSGTETQYESSPEQEAIYRAIQPLIQAMSQGQLRYGEDWIQPATSLPAPAQVPYPEFYGQQTITQDPGKYYTIGTYGTPTSVLSAVMNQPGPGVTPAQEVGGPEVGYLGDTSGYQAAQIGALPSTMGLMPTKDWYYNIPADVRQGAWAPWVEAEAQMREQFGSQGQTGSPRGGYSGAYGAAVGKLGSEAGQQVGMQLWNMMYPGMETAYQAGVGKVMQQAAYEQQARSEGYSAQQARDIARAKMQSEAGLAEYQGQLSQSLQTQELQAQAERARYEGQLAAGMQWQDIEAKRLAAQAEAETTRSKDWLEAAQRAYDVNYAAKQAYGQQQYDAANQFRQEQINAFLYPYNQLASLLTGAATTYPTGVTTQPTNWWERYVSPLLGSVAAGVGAGLVKK